MSYFVSKDEMDEAIEKAVNGIFKAIARYLEEEMHWEERIKTLEEYAQIKVKEELEKKDREKN